MAARRTSATTRSGSRRPTRPAWRSGFGDEPVVAQALPVGVAGRRVIREVVERVAVVRDLERAIGSGERCQLARDAVACIERALRRDRERRPCLCAAAVSRARVGAVGLERVEREAVDPGQVVTERPGGDSVASDPPVGRRTHSCVLRRWRPVGLACSARGDRSGAVGYHPPALLQRALGRGVAQPGSAHRSGR